jgi:hypothetical protein
MAKNKLQAKKDRHETRSGRSLVGTRYKGDCCFQTGRCDISFLLLLEID